MRISLLQPAATAGRTASIFRSLTLSLLLSVGSCWFARAQALTNYTFAASSSPYTALTLATNPTLTNLGGTAVDEGAYNALPLGFAFYYNGTAYTTVSASTNGWLTFGQSITDAAFTNNLTSGGTRPLVAPLWDDLSVGVATNFSYLTTGTAPNRVFTAEWKDVQWNYQATGAVISFQVRLTETSGLIEFAYSPGATAVNGGSASIGLAASGTGTSNFRSLNNTGAAPTASATAETTTLNAKPAANRVYSFTPPNVTPAAPTALTFATGYSSLTANFTDNSTTETTFNVLVSTTSPAGPYTATTAVTSTTGATTGSTYSATVSGLTANTTYFVRVVASTEGRASAGLDGSAATLTLPPAPLSGTYTINNTLPTAGTNFVSFADAFTALNAVGISGPVTMNVSAGQTFTARPPVLGNATLNANLSSTRTLTFVKSGAGVNPILAPTAGSGTNDAIIALAGADYVTFNAIDLTDPVANNSATKAAEFGFALFRRNATDGTQNTTITNCVVTLQRVFTASTTTLDTPIGIYSANTTAGSTTALTVTAIGGTNSTNTFTGNTLQNLTSGVVLLGSAVASPYTFYDQSNTIGGASAALGNTIRNFNGLTSGYAYGVRAEYQNNLLVRYNTIGNATTGGGAAVSSATDVYGISFEAGSAGTYSASNNTITLREAGNIYGMQGISAGSFLTGATLTMSTNNFVLQADAGATGDYDCMYMGGTLASLTATTNTFGSSTSIITNGTVTLLNTSNSTPIITFQNNVINGVTVTGTGTAGATFYGYYNNGIPSSGTATLTGNTFSNITLTLAADFVGIQHTTDDAQVATISGNSITGVTANDANSQVQGLRVGYNGADALITQNIIGELKGQLVYGIVIAGSSADRTAVTRNKVYGLLGNGQADSYVVGILVGDDFNFINAGIVTLSNNLIGDLTAPGATNTDHFDAVEGIAITAYVTRARLYHNTVYLNAAGGGNRFNSAGLFADASVRVDLRSNLIVNLSAPGSNMNARTAALRSNGTILLQASSDHNLYYAGTPGTKRLIFYNETSAVGQQTLSSYKTLVATQERNSKTENPPFLNTVGTSATFLHINPATPTLIESGGLAVSGQTDDYDATGVRTGYPLAGQTNGGGSAPDIGADEGNFTPSAVTDVGALALTAPLANQTCITAAEMVKVSIRNYSATPLTLSAAAPLTVSGSATDPGSVVTNFGPVTVSSGTIAANGTLEVTLSAAYNMSAVGTYSFNATASVSGDGNAFNAALSPAATVAVSGTNQAPAQTAVTASTSVCTGASFPLTVTGGGAALGTISGSQTHSPGLAIPEDIATGVTSTITLTGAGGATISAATTVKVKLNITHTYDADLDIYLIGPGACGALLLTSDNGGTDEDFVDTEFSTTATNIIGSAGNNTGPFTGTYRPEGTITTAPDRTGASFTGGTPNGTYNAQVPAGALAGCPVGGTWTLFIGDDEGIDIGTLDDWTLTITDAAVVTYAHAITGPGTISPVTYSGTSNATGTVTVSNAPVGANVYTIVTSIPGGCSTTSTRTITVTNTLTWTGAAGASWYAPGSWFPACVPTSTRDAVVPTGVSPAPTITSGTAQVRDLTVQGSNVLALSGTGNLDIYGTFSTASAASFAATAGTTSFVGPGAQAIPAGQYFNLVPSGTTAKVLTGAPLVASGLNLTAGSIDLGNFDLTMSDPVAGPLTTITGADATHYLQTTGTGRLVFARTGTGPNTRSTVVFPIGTSTSYLPATLTLSANSTYVNATRASVSNVVPIVSALDPTGVNVVQRTWDVGWGAGTLPTGETGVLTLQWNTVDEGLSFARSLCTVKHFENGVWNHVPLDFAAATSLGSNTWSRTRTQLTTFSPFAVADGDAVLPVELMGFDAVAQGQDALLTWATASEKDSRGFEVQVSLNGTGFRPLGFVASETPTSNVLRTYRFVDREAGKAGVRFYRLVQEDLDGTTSPSGIRPLRFDGKAVAAVSARPNPFGERLTVDVTAVAAGTAELTLVDALGRTVLTQTLPVAKGLNELMPVLPSRLAVGSYTLVTLVDGQRTRTRLVKQ